MRILDYISETVILLQLNVCIYKSCHSHDVSLQEWKPKLRWKLVPGVGYGSDRPHYVFMEDYEFWTFGFEKWWNALSGAQRAILAVMWKTFVLRVF